MFLKPQAAFCYDVPMLGIVQIKKKKYCDNSIADLILDKCIG